MDTLYHRWACLVKVRRRPCRVNPRIRSLSFLSSLVQVQGRQEFRLHPSQLLDPMPHNLVNCPHLTHSLVNPHLRAATRSARLGIPKSTLLFEQLCTIESFRSFKLNAQMPLLIGSKNYLLWQRDLRMLCIRMQTLLRSTRT